MDIARCHTAISTCVAEGKIAEAKAFENVLNVLSANVYNQTNSTVDVSVIEIDLDQSENIDEGQERIFE